MSVTYWMNEGIGVTSDALWPRLNMHKCFLVVREQVAENIKEEGFDLDDFFYGEPYENLGDFMCHVDDSGVMSWGDNGYGESYFLYCPSYPWYRRENEPSSEKEARKIIVDALLKVTDLSREEADKLICDIYEVGSG